MNIASFALGCLLTLAPISLSAAFYVDPVNGNDANTGTCAGSAFQTIAQAKTAVALVNSSMVADITVYLMPGVHTFTTPLTFGPYDGGTNAHRVIYKNFSCQPSVISGHVDLGTGWSLHDAVNGIYKRTGVSFTFRQLYVAGQQALRARTPNRLDDDTYGPYFTMTGADVPNRKYRIAKTDWDIVSGANLSAMEMVVLPHWIHQRARYDNATVSGSDVYVQPKTTERNLCFNKDQTYYQGTGYFFENSYDFLDAEGEWFLDEANSTLYYKPRSGEVMNCVSVLAPSLANLIVIDGTANLSFEGLYFEGTTWNKPSTEGFAAGQGAQPYEMLGLTYVRSATNASYPQGMVKIVNGRNLRFYQNTFTQAGANALQLFTDADDVEIEENYFYGIAANAIEVGANKKMNPANSEQCSNVRIWNNCFSKFGRDYFNGVAVLAHFVRDLVIDRNTIYSSPYTGLSLGEQQGTNLDSGMGYNLVRYNRIYDCMLLHDDGGGIYTLGQQRFSRVTDNYISELVRSGITGTFHCAGIYLDNHTEYFTVRDNVVKNSTELLFEHDTIGARNNNLANNVTTDVTIEDNAGFLTDYAPEAHPENLANGSSYSSDSGWTNVAALWDGESAADWQKPMALAGAVEGWVEYDFGQLRSDLVFRFREDNRGANQATDWKVQRWDQTNAMWIDIFSYTTTAADTWQETVPQRVATQKIRLYVKNTESGGQAAALEFQCFQLPRQIAIAVTAPSSAGTVALNQSGEDTTIAGVQTRYLSAANFRGVGQTISWSGSNTELTGVGLKVAANQGSAFTVDQNFILEIHELATGGSTIASTLASLEVTIPVSAVAAGNYLHFYLPESVQLQTGVTYGVYLRPTQIVSSNILYIARTTTGTTFTAGSGSQTSTPGAISAYGSANLDYTFFLTSL